MSPYYKDSNGNFKIDYDATKTWNYVNVDMYVNNMSDFSYGNYMYVALHEMGHSLSLAHNNIIGVSTVMRDNLGVLSHTEPTSSDQSHLRLKWGE